MVRPHQVGPDLPSGLRRPDRSVDLRSMPVQQMGLGVFDWGGAGNPPAIWRRGPGGPSWSLTTDAEGTRFLEATAEQARREGKDAPPPSSSLGMLANWVHEYLGKSPRYIALSPEGGIVDDVPEPGPEAAVDPEGGPEPERVPEPPSEAPGLLSQAVPSLGPQVLPQNVPVPNFQGPQAHMATGTPPGRVPGFRPGNEPQGSPGQGRNMPGHYGRPPGGDFGPEGPRHPSNPNWDPYAQVGTAQDYIDALNRDRAQRGLPPLTPEEEEAFRDTSWDEGMPEPPGYETRAVSPRSNALSNIMAMASGDPNQGILPGLTPEDEALAWIEKIRQGKLDTAKDPLDRPRPKGPPVGGEPPPLPPPVSPMISQMAGPMDYPDWRGDLDDWVPPDEEWSPEGGPEDLWNPESQMDRQYMAEMAAQRGAQPEHGYFGRTGSAVSGVVDDLSSMVQGMSAGERASMIGALVAAGLLMVGSGGTLIPIGLGVGAGLGAMSSAP